MKKFLVVLSMVTCLFGMTACGSEPEYTEQEQQKIAAAQNYVTNYVIPYFLDESGSLATQIVDSDDYTNDEIADEYKNYVEKCNEGVATYGMLVNAADMNGYDVESFVLLCMMSGQGDYSEFLEYDYDATTSNGVTTGSIIKSGFSSMNSGMDIVGRVIKEKLGEATSRIDGETIIVSVPVNHLKKDATIEVIVSNDKFMELKSVALNVNYSFGETMAKAGQNTLVGIGTVFVMLIVISFIISLFAYIPKIQDSMAKKKESPKAEAIEKAVAQIVEQEEAQTDDLTDDLELVAVIAAAIAAYEGQTSTDGFVVRSIRKVNRR